MAQSYTVETHNVSEFDEISKRVAGILPKLRQFLESAKNEGKREAMILFVDDKYAYAPKFSPRGLFALSGFGLFGRGASKKEDLHHPAYAQLWEAIEGLGYKPYIGDCGLGAAPVTFPAICAEFSNKISKQLQIETE